MSAVAGDPPGRRSDEEQAYERLVRGRPDGPGAPLSTIAGLVLDLETTGLDVGRARIVSFAAARIQGAGPPGAILEGLIDPGEPIPASASSIHGITDAGVAGKPAFREAWPALAEDMAGRVAIGHNIGFDIATLRRECERAGIEWTPPRTLDTALLAAALKPGLPDASLESVAKWLGVTVAGRHTARGDVETTTAIFAALVPRLAEAGVRTLAEADAFVAERAGDALRRHEAAGWHLQQHAPARRSLARDPFAYRHVLGDVMSAPPVFVDPGAGLGEAVRRMDAAAITAVFVGDAVRGQAEGILTDFDAVHALAVDGADALQQPVSRYMSSGVETLGEDEPVYRAIGRLERVDIRHLAVRDDSGRVVGSITARDLLRRSASAALVLGDAIAVARSELDLARAFAQVPDAAGALRDEELSTTRIAAIVSAEVRALTARAARLAQEECGPAPGGWALLVLGSAGRGESLLVPDQDNALIHDDAPGMADWAQRFGERINAILDAAGLPLCKGGVMAGREAWCRSETGWLDTLAGWVRRGRPDDLLNVDIFFDFVACAGDPDMAGRLRARSLEAARSNPPFIQALNAALSALRPARGLFGRLPTTDGRYDVKAGGLLPIVSFARASALHNGLEARGTAERLSAAAAIGAVPDSDAGALVRIHGELAGLALDQQLVDIAAGIRPSYRVELRRLSRADRTRLTDDLATLDDILSLAWSTLSRPGD